MEDWDSIFGGTEENSLAVLNSSSRSLQIPPPAPQEQPSDHEDFFKEYAYDRDGDEDRADSAMAVDADGDLSHISQDEEVARKLDYQFRSYNLRETSARDGKSVWITWLDNDTSGNYDPKNPEGAEERMGRPLSRSNSRHKRRRSGSVQHSRDYVSDGDAGDDDSQESQDEPRAAYLSRLAARQTGASITVTFDLTTTALKELARRIPDNWPGADHNVLSDEHMRFLAEQINSRNGGWKPYNLRRRESVHSHIDNDLDEEGLVLPDGRIPDPLPGSDEMDLRGHPEARGCKGCRSLNLICSLRYDENTWPCYTCANDDCDCELLTVPSKRKTCKDCQRRRVPCSYVSMASDPALPCAECASQGFTCIAGPEPSSIRHRICYDKDYSQPDTPVQDDRKFVTCTECRTAKKGCSLKNKFDFPPCESCQANGVACTFLPLRNSSRSSLRRPASKKKLLENSHYITTSLNHPIHFLHSDSDGCSWCALNIGVIGRGTREVLVSPSADGLSYTEISGGNNEDGDNSDHMCIQCTMERCRIVGCTEHEFRPIEEVDPETIDIDGMLERVIHHVPALPTDKWCGLCPAPALYECCTSQDCDMWGNPLDPRSKEAEGCGLVLCDNCAESYGELASLENVIDAVGNDEAREIWVMGLRADAEFLKTDGLLVRNVMAPMETDTEAMELS